jgi:hypothetical protein
VLKTFALITLILTGAAMSAEAQEKSEFEKLPVWPSDGKLNESQRGQYVFRDIAREEVVIVIPDDQKDPRGPYPILTYPSRFPELPKALCGIDMHSPMDRAPGSRLTHGSWPCPMPGKE